MVQSKMAIIYQHYHDTWETTKPGWYECPLHVEHIDKYVEMIDWLDQNIDKCQRHCRWGVTDTNVVSFKFRYERDYIMFTLRWS